MNREGVILSFFASLVSKRRPKQHVFDTVGRLVSKLNMKSVGNAVLNQGTILCKKTIPTVWNTSEDKVPYSTNVISVHAGGHSRVNWGRLFNVPRAWKNVCMTKPQNNND